MPLVVILFFVWGFITVLNDPLIAKLKGLFSLTYAEVMLTQFRLFYRLLRLFGSGRNCFWPNSATPAPSLSVSS
jgi:hypothetical protein